MSLRSLPLWLLVMIGLTGGIAIWRMETLAERPYWTSALGVFVRAAEIVDPKLDTGGSSAPSMHAYSFQPWILASVARLAPPGTPVLVGFRIITFAFASLALVAVLAMFHRPLGWSGGAIVAAAILTHPIVTVQVEQFGMEIPTVAILLCAALCLSQGAVVSSAVLGLLGFFSQWTAVAYLASALIYSLILAIARRGPARASGFSALVHAGTLALGIAVLFLGADATEWMGGWVPAPDLGTSPVFDLWKWTPDLLVLLLVTFIIVAAATRTTDDPTPIPESPTGISLWDFPICFGGIYTVVYLVLLTITGATPASLALLLPFVFLAIGWSVLATPATRLLGMAFLFWVVGFHLLNATGMALPPLPDSQRIDERTGAIRERSREYRDLDYRLNADIVRVLLDKGRDKKVVAPPPFVQHLSIPLLGYVTEPFEGYSLGTKTNARFPSIEQIRTDPPSELAIVAAVNRSVSGHEWTVPAPERGDAVLFPDNKEIPKSVGFQRSPIYLFVPRLFPSETEEASRDRYVRRFWPNEQLLPRARQLIEMGQLRNAEIILRQLLEGNSKAHAVRLELALLLDRQGKGELCIRELDRIPPEADVYLEAVERSADIKIRAGDLAGAEKDYQRIDAALDQRSNPDRAKQAEIRYKRALILIACSEWAQAADQLARVLDVHPGYEAAYRDRGLAFFRLGDYAESRRQLELALDIDPSDGRAHAYLGGAYGVEGDWERAFYQFREALRLVPGDPDASEGLGLALTKLNRTDEAIQHYERMLGNELPIPQQSVLLRGLAEAQLLKGDWPAAINSLRRSVQLDTKALDNANRLAWILATYPNDDARSSIESIELAERIAKPEDAPSVYIDTLAAAYAEGERWDEAVQSADRAIARAREENRPDLVGEYTERRDRYARKEPYRDEGQGVEPETSTPEPEALN